MKGRLPEAPEKSLSDILDVRLATQRRAADAGQNDREARDLRQAEINTIETYIKALRDEPDQTPDGQFDVLRGLFAGETGRRETLADETGTAFDNAFRFLETAVGPSQELVLFVTEITAGFDSSWFVGEFGCDAYFRNNRDLLFDETRQRILDKIAPKG